MAEDTTPAPNAEAVAACGGDGMKCAVVSWVMPLLAVGVLVLGMRFPVLRVFNIFILAFGIMALFRSVTHIRRFGACGLGGHVAVGGVLNVAVLALIILYVATALDPLSIRVG